MLPRIVIDYFTQKVEPKSACIKFINNIEDGITFYEYTTKEDELVKLCENGNLNYYNKSIFGDRIVIDKRNGFYRVIDNLSLSEIVSCNYEFRTTYNYTFPKHYEARESFNIFKDKQYLVNPEIEFKLAKYLKYTFGLEFETAVGTIPQEICFRDGLIPLRDGSITGNEYSTVVLNGNFGLNLLKQQLATLSEYTYFDKNCSLHVHVGGFKLKPEIIWRIYKICLNLQPTLQSILPQYTFKSSLYKDTHKDYCKMLPTFTSFESFYKNMTGYPYLGSIYEPHPKDVEHQRKWNIDQRYYWINFINCLCYSENKTVEFRFLRPTYNINKIIFWLYVFNAIVYSAENGIVHSSFESLFKYVYPDIVNDLLKNAYKTQVCTQMQSMLQDNIGERVDIENRIFDTTELI